MALYYEVDSNSVRNMSIGDISIYTDKGMQTNNDNIPNKEYNEKNKYHINSNLKESHENTNN